MNIKRELLLYILFGILTTVVNIFAYLFCSKFLNIPYLISNILAWFFSVLFAYITNRIWVFESENTNILKEISLFFSSRLFSGILDTILMILFIDVLLIDDFLSKIVIAVVVVIVNYVLSKRVIFKN